MLLLGAATLSHHAKDWADILKLAAYALAVAATIRVSRAHHDDTGGS